MKFNFKIFCLLIFSFIANNIIALSSNVDSKRNSYLYQQHREIQGKVTDAETGESLVGVSV